MVISVSNPRHRIYLPELANMIAQEAENGNMLAWAEKELAEQMTRGNACIALLGNQVIGYVGIMEWEAYVEICALIVKPEYREQGIGSNLVRKAIAAALKKFPSKQIIILPNRISGKISLKLGFFEKAKAAIKPEIWAACVSCKEVSTFPNCHCRPMIFQKKGSQEPGRRTSDERSY